MLLCPVRTCGLPLTRETQRWVCPGSHSFDIARSGYLNLLQPQDRRSKHPGDSTEAVAARRRLHAKGITAPLAQAIENLFQASSKDTVLDAGCGDGFYLGSLQARTGCQAHGVDISTPAIDAAARAYPDCQWIVANADRRLPFSDASFNRVISITGRMNPAEFHRVLKPDGLLLIAIPAPDDLVQIRGQGRDRVQRTLQEFTPAFSLRKQERATTTADLDEAAVEDLRVSVYRPLGPAPHPGPVTFSLDLLLLQPSGQDHSTGA